MAIVLRLQVNSSKYGDMLGKYNEKNIMILMLKGNLYGDIYLRSVLKLIFIVWRLCLLKIWLGLIRNCLHKYDLMWLLMI